MDAELRELERLFEAAQQARPSARLSERNIVELVVKLQELGLLDSDLLHTVSGKEYITQDRLRQEMEAEIKRRGRVSLVEMASSVGVDYFHCERQAEAIKESVPWVMVEQSEVFTSSYWDSLAEEVNETLKEASHVSLGELATRFNVGVELLTGMLSSRIGRLVHAKLEGGQLYTEAYVARVKGMVRGAIRALTVPTTLQSVWSFLQSQLRDRDDMGVTGELSLFSTVLNELVSEGSVKGNLRGGGSTWTPSVFAQSQRESVEAFYSQNSFITYAALTKLNVSQPKQYLQTKYPEGIALETVFVHASFISLLDTSAEVAITGVGWFDALEVVPSTFDSRDSSKLLLLCPSVQRGLKESTVSHIAETCVVSTEFVKALLERFQDIVREAQAKNVDVKTTRQTEPDTGPGKTKTKASKVYTDMDDDDDANVVKGRNKKRGSKARSGKGSGAIKETKVAKQEDNDVPSEEKLAENIIEWYPDLESAGTDDGYSGVLAKSLAVQLRPPLLSYSTTLKRAFLGAKAEEQRKRTEALQLKLNEEYAKLQLFSKALDLFDDDKGLEGVLQKHLLRTFAGDIADVWVEAQVLEQKLETSENCDPLPSKPFTAAVRTSLAKSLPGSISSAACEMVETLEGKDIGAFESAFEMAVRESGLRVKRLDRKGERTLFHAYRKNLAEEVDNEQDPIALLPKVVALLYAQLHGRALQTPGRAISSAVSRLEKQLPEKAFKALVEYHAATVACLSGSEEVKEEKRGVLLERMGELRAVTHTAGADN